LSASPTVALPGTAFVSGSARLILNSHLILNSDLVLNEILRRPVLLRLFMAFAKIRLHITEVHFVNSIKEFQIGASRVSLLPFRPPVGNGWNGAADSIGQRNTS